MSTQHESDTQTGVAWNPSVDIMLADWCDQSKCFQWMHTAAYSRYSRRATAMTITANISISLSGIANLILGSTIPDTKITSIIFGCISIGIGVVNMIQEQFNWPVLATNFKQSADKWGVVTRKIEEQLVIPYGGRKDCGTFLKYIKQDINDVSTTNSLIPEDIRIKCTEKFKSIPNFDIPDICGQVEHTAIYVAPAAILPIAESSPLNQPLLSNTHTQAVLSTIVGPLKGFNLGLHG